MGCSSSHPTYTLQPSASVHSVYSSGSVYSNGASWYGGSSSLFTSRFNRAGSSSNCSTPHGRGPSKQLAALLLAAATNDVAAVDSALEAGALQVPPLDIDAFVMIKQAHWKRQLAVQESRDHARDILGARAAAAPATPGGPADKDSARRARPEDSILHGKTALMVAAESRALGALELLLIRGAGPDVADESGQTALHYAAAADAPPIINALLAFRARVDAGAHDSHAESTGLLAAPLAGLTVRDASGPLATIGTPLHAAVAAGALRAVGALLAAGADYNLLNGEGQTPLGLAVRQRHWEAAELLLAAAPADGGAAAEAEKARRDRHGTSELANRPTAAAPAGSVVGSDGNDPAGSMHNSVVGLGSTRSAGSPSPSSGRSPAASLHTIGRAGAHPAETSGRPSMSSRSILHGPSMSSSKMSMSTAWPKLAEAIKVELRFRLVLDERDIHTGRSELLWAVIHGQEALARRLVALGADPACEDYSGSSPLEQAKAQGLSALHEFLAAVVASSDSGRIQADAATRAALRRQRLDVQQAGAGPGSPSMAGAGAGSPTAGPGGGGRPHRNTSSSQLGASASRARAKPRPNASASQLLAHPLTPQCMPLDSGASSMRGRGAGSGRRPPLAPETSQSLEGVEPAKPTAGHHLPAAGGSLLSVEGQRHGTGSGRSTADSATEDLVGALERVPLNERAAGGPVLLRMDTRQRAEVAEQVARSIA